MTFYDQFVTSKKGVVHYMRYVIETINLTLFQDLSWP